MKTHTNQLDLFAWWGYSTEADFLRSCGYSETEIKRRADDYQAMLDRWHAEYLEFQSQQSCVAA